MSVAQNRLTVFFVHVGVGTVIWLFQARTGPAGYREIPGGPVGRWAGGPAKILWGPALNILAIDVINYDEKNKIVYQGLWTCNGQTSQTKNRKN